MLDVRCRQESLTPPLLNGVRELLAEYQNATRVHVAVQILAAAGRETTLETITETGSRAPSIPTMWR
jgi:hypothetical protein